MAHDSPQRNEWLVYQNEPTFCVEASGFQRHDYHVIKTTSLGDYACYGVKDRDAGFIKHRAEWYVNGRYCAYLSEQTSTYRTFALTTTLFQDVWSLGCNNGPGVHVWITTDTWNWAAYGPYWYPYYGGYGIRPITGHCHCP